MGKNRDKDEKKEEGLPCPNCKQVLNSLGNKNPICLIECMSYVPAFIHTPSWRVKLLGDSPVTCKSETGVTARCVTGETLV